MRSSIIATAVTAAVLSCAAFGAQAAAKSDISASASISMQQARATALKTFNGTVVKQELEKEKGGSGLRYSFDIKQGKVTHEVGVDAQSGKVLENSIEGSDND